LLGCCITFGSFILSASVRTCRTRTHRIRLHAQARTPQLRCRAAQRCGGIRALQQRKRLYSTGLLRAWFALDSSVSTHIERAMAPVGRLRMSCCSAFSLAFPSGGAMHFFLFFKLQLLPTTRTTSCAFCLHTTPCPPLVSQLKQPTCELIPCLPTPSHTSFYLGSPISGLRNADASTPRPAQPWFTVFQHLTPAFSTFRTSTPPTAPPPA